jgi:hypothetical protein
MGVTITTNSTCTYIPIQTQTLVSNAASVTFSSIPQTYTDLILVYQVANVSGNAHYVYAQVGNGTVDSGNNYSETYIYGSGTAASSFRHSSANHARLSLQDTATWSIGIAHFMNYSNTTSSMYKTILTNGGGTTSGNSLSVNLWQSSSAINVITLTDELAANFNAGSTFTLFGILGA